MPTIGQQRRAYQFGVFELDPQTRELRKNGVKRKLQEQPLQILIVLLERPGEIVTREEIQKRLWPEDTYVDFDNAINSAVRKLRDALDDAADNPRFIETVARRGYRFIAPVNGPATVQPVTSGGAEAGARRLPMQKLPWALLAIVLISAIGAGIVYKMRFAQSQEVSDALPPPVPLTSYPGFQWSPSFSPDGTRVAFTWEEPGKGRPGIYVKLIGPMDPVRLSSGEEGDFAPVWSPDGSWIAFLQIRGPFSCAVMLIPSLGGRARELARVHFITSRFSYEGGSVSVSPPYLAWSSDGKWLLSLEQSGPEVPQREAPMQIVRISVDSGEKTPFTLSFEAGQERREGKRPMTVMTDEEGLAISPDGKKLAFISGIDQDNASIYLVMLTKEMMPSGPARSLHFEKSRCHGIGWDADGRDLIVSSNRRGSTELWRVPVSRSAEPSRINVSDDLPLDLAISQTGQRMAYTHYSEDWNIWRVDLTSTRLKNAVALINSTRNEYHPSYSADGKHIAFESNRFGHSPEIWVSDADGSHAVQITSFGNGWAGSPNWSPDAQHIAFDGHAAGQWDIYVISPQGGKAVRITSGSGSKVRPRWSHDGKWIYYCTAVESDPQIWKKPATGGAEMQITKNGGCNQMESPDGHYVYYLGRANSDLRRVPVEGGEETQLVELGPQSNSTAVGGSHFTLGNHGVYFFDSVEANTLKFMDYGTRSIKVLGTLPGPIMHGFAVSPDEHWLLYTKVDSAASQLMLVDNFK